MVCKLVMGNGAPIPSFPHPPNYRDGAGMGTWYEKTLGFFWGQGRVENWGFLGFYPRKSPKRFWGHFGDGDDINFGEFWGFNPRTPQNFGDFRVFLNPQHFKIFKKQGLYGSKETGRSYCSKVLISQEVLGYIHFTKSNTRP